jgi:hypothetical protein
MVRHDELPHEHRGEIPVRINGHPWALVVAARLHRWPHYLWRPVPRDGIFRVAVGLVGKRDPADI